MSKGHGPWRDGRRAWERLDGWQDERGPAAGGDDALTALADIGFVRHLLDQAELTAVRTARRHRKSWAEIATKLGVTRQSAWERWRDLDDSSSPSDPVDSPNPTGPDDAITAATASAVARTALDRRRRSTVVVPNVIGLTWPDARRVLQDVDLVAVGVDPDGPPLSASSPSAQVRDQSPESGAKVPIRSHVTLWMSDNGGGSAGVREPRRPRPDPKSGRELPIR